MKPWPIPILLSLALGASFESRASYLTWTYQDGEVDCSALLSHKESWLTKLGLLPPRGVIFWSTSMFVVTADGEVHFGDRSETSSNLLAQNNVEPSQLKIPVELVGRDFTAIALVIHDLTSPVLRLFAFLPGNKNASARLVDLQSGERYPLEGFDQFHVSSLYYDRLHVLKTKSGDFVLRLSQNAHAAGTGEKRVSLARPVFFNLTKQRLEP